MNVLAIDPGKHEFGWALFESSLLVNCGMLPSMHYHKHTFKTIDRLVLEDQQIYNMRKTDANDLLPLAHCNGFIVADLDPMCYEFVLPRVWKGQVPKSLHQERIHKKLTPAEQILWPKNHNVKDAIGIGLWALGREA